MASSSGNDNSGMSLELMQLATLRDKVSTLPRKVDRQALLIEALWQFVKATGDLEDEDLKAMVEKAGQPGGLVRQAEQAKPQVCPACEEPVKGTREQCFWCGHKFPAGLFGP